MSVQNRFLTSSLVILSLVSFNVSAASKSQDDDSIIVTATRTAQSADESLASVTVISREQIELTQARTVSDYLKREVGIHVSRSGGIGKNTSIFMRGTNSDHVLVLIDGVRAGSATLGSYQWENLSPDQIERIEIVRGPRASLYGSDAIGGVIQIFTRKPSETSVKVGFGSHNTKDYSVSTGGGDKFTYNLMVGKLTTDGIPTLVTDTTSHGYETTNVNMGVGYQFNKTDNVDLRFNQSNGNNFLDSSTGNSSFKQRTISSTTNIQTTSIWQQKFTLGNFEDVSTSHSPTLPSSIITNRDTFAWQNDFSFNRNVLTTGYDYYTDNATKDQNGTIDKTIYNSAVYLQYQLDWLASDWVFGARRDNHSAFGYNNTWNVSWGTDIGKDTRLFAAHGTAFKAPTINGLYWPYSSDVFFGTTYITQGNPNLVPEKSATSELGLQTRFDKNTFKINIFRTETENLIEWVTTQTGVNTYTTTPSNISRVKIKGAEFQADFPIENWNINTKLNMLSAVDQARQQQLDNRPKRSGALGISRKGTDSVWQLDWLVYSERNDRNAAVKLSAYALVNLAYNLDISSAASVNMRIENLFDKGYAEDESFSGRYQTYGRSGFITFTYKI